MIDSAFRLLDLPPELQRSVLCHHFDRDWTVTLCQRHGTSLKTTYAFDIPLNVLLTCRRLYVEGREALREHKRGKYRLLDGSHVSDVHFAPMEPCFWDSAIVTIGISNWRWLSKASQLALKRRFTNLRAFHYTLDYSLYSQLCDGPHWRNEDLSALLQGKRDPEFGIEANNIHKKYLLEMSSDERGSYDAPVLLSDIDHLLTVKVKLEGSVQLSNSLKFYLGGQQLFAEFEVTANGCDVRRKWYQPKETRVNRRLRIEDVIAKIDTMESTTGA